MARDYDPSTLGEIDAVEVVEVDLSAVGGSRDFLRRQDFRRIMLKGVDAERIADLWRQLRPDEEARCHDPPYGLRFLRGGEMVAEATLCWACGNAYGAAGNQSIHFTFDAQSLAAVALLLQLRHVLPAKR